MKRVYLDYAAATPLDPKAKKAMEKTSGLFANPSALYASAREAKKSLDQARKSIGMFLGANSDEVILTSGATESNNLAILGSARTAKKGRIISIKTEHVSVREPLSQLSREGYEVVWCNVDQNGKLDQADFSKKLTEDTIVVSLAYANSEIGAIQPLQKVVQQVREFEKLHKCRILVHTDASAAALLLKCDVSRLGVDLLTLSSGKIYGPAGVAALYVRRGVSIKPVTTGGGQEGGLRAGTSTVELSIGFAAALKIVQKRRKEDEKSFALLKTGFKQTLEELGLMPQVGSGNQLNNVITMYFDGINGEDIVAYMDSAGFEAATGAACEAGNEEPSQALLAVGLSQSQAQGSIRISFGRQTTKANVQAAAKVLIKTLDTLNYQWDLPTGRKDNTSA